MRRIFFRRLISGCEPSWGPSRDWGCDGGRVFPRSFSDRGWIRGLGFEAGGNRGGRRGVVRGRRGDQPARWPRRHRRFGSDPGRSEAGAGGRPAGDCRRAGQGPRRAAAGVPGLRGRLPRDGLSPARDRHTVRPSRGPVAPLPLCWLRHDRDGRGMAAIRPLDSGVGSAAGTALRSADLPDGSRPARADVPGGRWPGPGDVAPSYLQDRQDPVDDIRSRGARQRRCEGNRRELGFNLHPQLRGRRAAPRGPDRQCRNRVRRTTGFRRCREGQHGHWGADPPRPRRRRQDRGHGADRLHRRLPRAPTHPGRRWRHRAADTRLVPHRHAAAAPEASRRRAVGPGSSARGGEGDDHHGGRTIALAHLERQGQGRADQHRSHSRTLALLRERARSQAAAGARRGGPLSTLPEHPSGRLRRTAPGPAAGRHGADRGHGQLPGEPPPGQVAADALDPARGRSAAPRPLRPLQRPARHRFREKIPADQRPTPANGGGRLTPNFAKVPSSADPLRYRLHHLGAGRAENRITRCPLFRGKVTSVSRYRRVLSIALIWAAVALIGASPASTADMPRLSTKDGRHALIVDGKPFLVLGAQIHNSSNYPSVLPQIWPVMRELNANTVEAPVAWEQLEPAEGQFDFTWVDALLAQARKNEMKVVLLWFSSWKNGESNYAPEW